MDEWKLTNAYAVVVVVVVKPIYNTTRTYHSTRKGTIQFDPFASLFKQKMIELRT